MTVREYLDALFKRLDEAFAGGDGREMTMADSGTVYMICTAHAAAHKDLPRTQEPPPPEVV